MNLALKIDKNSKNVIFKDEKCKNWKCFARSKLNHKVITANYIMHYILILFYFIVNVTFLILSLLNNKQNRTEQILLQVNYTVSCDIT